MVPMLAPIIQVIRRAMNQTPDFYAPLKTSLALSKGSGTHSFSRASTAYVEDHLGILNQAKSGEVRFTGARRVENLFSYSEDFSNAAWDKENTTVETNAATAPDGSLTADRIIESAQTGLRSVKRTNVSELTTQGYTESVHIKLDSSSTIYRHVYLYLENFDSGSYTAEFNLETGVVVSVTAGATASITALDNNWYRIGISLDSQDTDNVNQLKIGAMQGTLGDGDFKFFLWGAQLETGLNVSEYVSTNVLSSPLYHGANVDGVKYFDTNIAGVPISNLLLKGYLSEGQRTNLLKDSENITVGSAWFGVPAVSVANQVVAPNGSKTADMIDYTSNAQVYQVVTVTGSTVYTYSYYVKLGTKPNNKYAVYDVTNSAFIVGTAIASGTSSSSWKRVVVTFTTPVSCTSVRVYCDRYDSGDTNGTLYVWGAQLEEGNFATSYIPTAAASVTRATDFLTYPSANHFNNKEGSVCAEASTLYATTPIVAPILMASASTAYLLYIAASIAANHIKSYDGTNSVTSANGSNFNTAMIKVAGKWGAGLKSVFKESSIVTNAFDADMTDSGNISIGSGISGGNNWYGHVRNVKIWRRKRANAFLSRIAA
jgi:hypothetical protein